MVAEPEVEEIVSLGRTMGLLVDEEDIDELLEEHKQELSTEDLKELEAMRVTVVQEQYSADEEEEEEREATTTTAEIKDFLASYQKVADFIEKKHPEKVHTGRLVAQFNDICVSHFRNIVKSRQKQTSLDRYFKRPRVTDSEEEGESDPKKRKTDDESSDEN